MAYLRTNWVESETPLSADNMNNIEDGIEEALAGLSVNNLKAMLIDVFYPVGTYYETDDANFNPNAAWGGTWVLEAPGKVHVGAGSGYPIGSTGGAATHKHTTGNCTLTAAQSGVPQHTHTGPEHTHTGPEHTHTMAHTHTGPNHSHGVGSNANTRFVAVEDSQNKGIGEEGNITYGYLADEPVRKVLMVRSSTNKHPYTLQGAANWMYANGTAAAGTGNTGAASNSTTSKAGTGATGKAGTGATGKNAAANASSAHNHGDTGNASNMQPHIAINRWHRTA